MGTVWMHMKEALAPRPLEAEKNTRTITISKGPATIPNHFKSVSNKNSRTNINTRISQEVQVALHILSQDVMTLFRTEKAQ